MAYPLMEHPLGDSFYYNGTLYSFGSSVAADLMKPNESQIYYETVRVLKGCLLFVEDHMARLTSSVKGLEDFPIDTGFIVSEGYRFIRECKISSGNIRIVLTKTDLLIHSVDVKIPSSEDFSQGVNTSIFNWERKTPNLKIFRGDYKTAVNQKFSQSNSHGLPFELILSDSSDKLYEGSMSNLFVVRGGNVYSAPDSKILIGITRRRVITALERSGLGLKYGMFTLDEIKDSSDCAMFVSSTPFDILPIRYIDDYELDSASDPVIKAITAEYANFTKEYINERGDDING